MIPDLSFKDAPILIRFDSVIIHERGSHVPWDTLRS